MIEEWKLWKPSKEWILKSGKRCSSEAIYISNLGNVRGRKTMDDNRGYLCISYNHKKYSIHRLVAELFIPNPFKKREVDHIDNNKYNNAIHNLRWVTPKENMNNKITKEKIKRQKIEHRKTKVFCVELNKIFDSTRDAAKYICGSDGAIRMVCRGVNKTASGYHWRYIK